MSVFAAGYLVLSSWLFVLLPIDKHSRDDDGGAEGQGQNHYQGRVARVKRRDRVHGLEGVCALATAFLLGGEMITFIDVE